MGVSDNCSSRSDLPGLVDCASRSRPRFDTQNQQFLELLPTLSGIPHPLCLELE